MGGGLMQLVAYGAQDIYLTGNPQITFFKVVYRRHTNFSMESIQQTFNGSVVSGGQVSATISRNGDLVHRCYVTFNPSTMTGTAGVAPYLGHGILQEVSVEIGGQLIDRQYGHWLTTWHELTSPTTSCTFPKIGETGNNQFTTSIPSIPDRWRAALTGTPAVLAAVDPANSHQDGNNEILFPPTARQRESFYCKCINPTHERYASIPLQFWFCRNPGLALPLIALQYHEVKIIINIGDKATLGTAALAIDPGMALWCDYIYLDTDERRRFAQVSHEYLIEQVQYQQTTCKTTMDLNFNHPVKELIWTGAHTKLVTGSENDKSIQTTEKLGSTENTTFISEGPPGGDCTINIKLNGHDRFAPRHTGYFTRTQVAAHHTGNGGVQCSDSIHVYSFALKPEEHQPSGTCNFSRIDTAQLIYSVKPVVHSEAGAPIHIYAVNYNVLRIMSGMGGLAYSN
jgi:hypothetical protein